MSIFLIKPPPETGNICGSGSGAGWIRHEVRIFLLLIVWKKYITFCPLFGCISPLICILRVLYHGVLFFAFFSLSSQVIWLIDCPRAGCNPAVDCSYQLYLILCGVFLAFIQLFSFFFSLPDKRRIVTNMVTYSALKLWFIHLMSVKLLSPPLG